MRVDLLRAAIEEDQRANYQPMAVVATVGTTSTTSVDPVRDIAEVCQRYGLWLHVDAARQHWYRRPLPFSMDVATLIR